MKKFVSVILALALVLSLGVAAFATENTGSITISNATIDQTYTVYKIFDASIKLGSDGNAEAVSYSIATDSQFFEIKQYSALQIASAFGVRPYQIGDYTKTSYSSAEAQQLSFLIDTLLFILKGYEEEVGYKLLSDKEEADGLHVKFNTGVLLRADQRTQIETLSTAVNSFLLTPNEAREMLDKPAMPGGDKLLGNGASIPVQYTGSQYANTAREEEKKWLEETIRKVLSENSV